MRWQRYPDLFGLKGTSADLSVRGKKAVLNAVSPLNLQVLSERKVCGMRVVAVKYIDIKQNADCEGSLLDCN